MNQDDINNISDSDSLEMESQGSNSDQTSKQNSNSQTTVASGALVGGLTSIPMIALMYLGLQVARLSFVPFDFFDWLARILPGEVITTSIDLIVRTISILNLGDTSRSAKLSTTMGQ